MNLACKKDYYLESFVFQSNEDLFVHLQNVEKRAWLRAFRLICRPRKSTTSSIGGDSGRFWMPTTVLPLIRQDRYYFKHDDDLDIDFGRGK
ncbi:MAG: hypothetical protein R2827_08990 [Bdellovibrionales bacterium]